MSQLCIAMLRKLGLLMGCFDFVVTPENDIVFLEVNEGGQFLWLESASGAPILDAFSDFLIRPRVGFRWKPPQDPIRVEHVQAAATQAMAQAAEAHLAPEPSLRIDTAASIVMAEPSD